MSSTNRMSTLIALAVCCLSLACQPKAAEQTTTETTTTTTTTTTTIPPVASRYLYVASGTCQASSGVTTFTATTSSNLVFRVNLSTGMRDSIIADYNASPASAGDTPVGVVDWDTDHLAVLVGNGTSGRLEVVPKNASARANFGLTPGPATIFSAIPRFMSKTNDGGLFTIRSGAIDKISSSGIRLSGPSASVNYVMNNLGATCGTTNTLYSFALHTGSANNRIIAGHAVAAQNRLISMPAVGASSATQCIAAQAAPGAGTSWPLAAVYDSVNSKLIVAWGNSATTANTNMIISYDYNDSTGAIGTANTLYDISTGTYPYTLFNVSAMTLDPTTNTIYMATAISTATTVVNYAIEKFTYDASKIGVSNAAVLTRVGSVPFYSYGVDTKCIAGMTIAY